MADLSGGWEACTKDEPCDEGFGDCDKDHDCKGSLRCYFRDEGQFVPGIDTSQLSDDNDDGKYDICFDPTKLDPRGDTWCANVSASDIHVLQSREAVMEMYMVHCNENSRIKSEENYQLEGIKKWMTTGFDTDAKDGNNTIYETRPQPGYARMVELKGPGNSVEGLQCGLKYGWANVVNKARTQGWIQVFTKISCTMDGTEFATRKRLVRCFTFDIPDDSDVDRSELKGCAIYNDARHCNAVADSMQEVTEGELATCGSLGFSMH